MARLADLEATTRRAEAAEANAAARADDLAALTARAEGLEGSLRAATVTERDLTARAAALDARLESAERRLAERRTEAEARESAIAGLRGRLEAEQAAQRALQARIAGLTQELESEQARGAEKVALLSSVREDMQARFRDLADAALKTQAEVFSNTSFARLEATLTPLKEHVGHFEKELRAVHTETARDRERLKAEIAALSKRSEEVSHEAMALTRALKGDRQRQGAWGEMILESILERCGLREGEEYETQAHRTDDEGARLRPDVVVRIPGDRTLVIDSKVSLNDYAAAVNAEDAAEAAGHRKRHVAALRAHITGLSAKGYQRAEDASVDYVIMFVPIEGALSEALREDGGLTGFALERHITIATPTTLMMALRTVAHVWAVERRNRNAEAIADRAGKLYDKLVGFLENMETVGKRLDQAQAAYGDALGQLSRGRGNLLSQVETLKTLGAKATKTIATEFEDTAPPGTLAADPETDPPKFDRKADR
ncbi:recombinase RmuC [Rhodobaculum claviforme]|uniref:DNA recombination protein RmuC homolog n=2 Tax=Rhodobaculum claviforme TaxID=1549854 RepID=A0A934TMA7_9RHOB|nr:recombinase RmuC [Rhodobaculum claviforme]